MTALLSRCETCDGGAQVPLGAVLSSFPNLGLIDSYKFSLSVCSGVSAVGWPNRSAKRQDNFSLPFLGRTESSFVPAVGFSELRTLPDSGDAPDFSRIFFTVKQHLRTVLGLHGDFSTLRSAGLKIWCSGGKKNPSAHLDFPNQISKLQLLQQTLTALSQTCDNSAHACMQESMHAECIHNVNYSHLPGMAGTTEALAGMFGVPCEMKQKTARMTFWKWFMIFFNSHNFQ